MKSRLGISFMCIGAISLLSAISLFCINQIESKKAADFSAGVMSKIVNAIENTESTSIYNTEMAQAEIDGEQYIGCISIPDLSLELPVMSGWSYEKLKKAPCRYSGTVWDDDLVILAHNYTRHFGSINKLSIGAEVYFTDMNGIVTKYTVESVEALLPTAVKDMTSGDYDLTLFTCNYSGNARVTVRCEKND